MTIDRLRREATALKRAYGAQIPDALLRVAAQHPRAAGVALKHTDFLHVIACERGFASWPHLKAAVDLRGLDRAQQQQRLAQALKLGHDHVTNRLLTDDPDLPWGDLALSLLLYRADGVTRLVLANPARAVEPVPLAPPLTVLAQSRAIHLFPDRAADMRAIADLLLTHGADVNDAHDGLSVLYFAIGHADNMALAEWLLNNGADPNDGESLYHATELGHHRGLRLLLDYGASPKGTNAVLRAMDFHDVEAVRLSLDAGGVVEDFNGAEVDGEAPSTLPALHQAARRMSPPAMIDLLLERGADPARLHGGLSPYAYARLVGHAPLADRLPPEPLEGALHLMAQAAAGEVPDGQYVDPAKLPDLARSLIRDIVELPGKQGHITRLAAIGVEYDRPDASGVTPVQAAGWAGLPDVMGVLLDLKPDLGHVNAYGGTLLGTILHGAQNCPERARRDHIGCLRRALEEGVALPRSTLQAVSADGPDPEIATFLRDWARAKPGQVVEDGG